MKKTVAIIALLCLCVISVQGQLKMNNNGKMYLGTPWSGQDQDNVLSGSVFGPYGTYKAGSKLAFGDFGRLSFEGGNVFVGEYGIIDTDQLWLHGKSGIYLTRGSQTIDIVAYCLSQGNDGFYFSTKVYSKGVILSSDARFKSNVKQIESPLSKLLSLNGVSYDFSDKLRRDDLLQRHNDANVIEGENLNEDDYELSEKEIMDTEKYEAYINQGEAKESKLGFIAQELQMIFPDLVEEDDLGYLGIDYNGLIPVIVEAMKEQQNMINEQNRRIELLEIRLTELGGGIIPPKSSAPTVIEETGNNATNTFLYQNVPNPFTERTEIKYFLPENSRNAQLYIFNMQGQNVKTVNISNYGNGSIFIQGAELAPGTYIYALYSNGKELDTKRMILTK
jgi:hypothetical protein